MKAWLLDALTGIQNLRLADVPDPVPKADEAVLEVHYAALNPADRYLAERQYPAKPALPHILGRDGLGTVIRVGDGAGRLRPGDRRIILRSDIGSDRSGTFAERVVVPAESLVEVPDGWSEVEAAGAGLVCLTAYQALTMWGPLPESPVVLVTGASGGVGAAAVQLASAMGHTVVALSRSAAKSERLRELGAAATFNPSEPRWRQALKTAIAPRRVALAIDNVGGALLPEVIDTLGDLGKASLVGRLAGPVPNFNTASLFFRRIRLGGVAVGAYSSSEALAAWREVVRLLSLAAARPQVDSVWPFEQLPRAFERLAQGPMGKVVLQVKEGATNSPAQ
ncbi:MAG: quinone oxidoreductase family protein [Limisphaerales bacterium]